MYSLLYNAEYHCHPYILEAATVQGAGDTPLQDEVQPLTQTQPSLTDQGSSGDDDELLEEDDEDDKKTFEQRLQDWLSECRQQRSQKQVSEIGTNDDFEDIKRLVWHFGITHYVMPLNWGALHTRLSPKRNMKVHRQLVTMHLLMCCHM